MKKRATEIYRTDWNGILLEITYEPVWMPACIMGQDIAHLQVRSIYPTDAPLPIAKNGYFMQSPAASAIAAAGGPVAYVDVILEAETAAP